MCFSSSRIDCILKLKTQRTHFLARDKRRVSAQSQTRHAREIQVVGGSARAAAPGGGPGPDRRSRPTPSHTETRHASCGGAISVRLSTRERPKALVNT